MMTRLADLGRWFMRREPPPAVEPPAPLAAERRAAPVLPPIVADATPEPAAAPLRSTAGTTLAKVAPSVPAETKPLLRPVVVVTLLGLDGESLETVADLVERQCKEREMQAVCVTDQADFGPFRRRGLIADQVVDAERRAMDVPELPWRLYRHAQFMLLGRRWRPATVISFGRPPDPDCLKALEHQRA
jgi:hypothetical protein